MGRGKVAGWETQLRSCIFTDSARGLPQNAPSRRDHRHTSFLFLGCAVWTYPRNRLESSSPAVWTSAGALAKDYVWESKEGAGILLPESSRSSKRVTKVPSHTLWSLYEPGPLQYIVIDSAMKFWCWSGKSTLLNNRDGLYLKLSSSDGDRLTHDAFARACTCWYVILVDMLSRGAIDPLIRDSPHPTVLTGTILQAPQVPEPTSPESSL